jgi:ribonucleotide monophosphatase NagD (HAD superfamily)
MFHATQQLRAAGKRIFFVTNNSTKSRKGYKKKFDELGLDVQPEEVRSLYVQSVLCMYRTFFVCTDRLTGLFLRATFLPFASVGLDY